MTLPSSPSRPLVVLDALLVTRQPTGVGRSILELLRALSRQDRGFDFLVLATEPEMFNWLEGKPDWEVLPCPDARGGVLRKSLFTQFKIPGICSRYGAAILHSLQFVAPLRLGCSSVVTVHDLGYLRFPDTVEEPRRSYYRFFVPRTLKRAACIVTNSQATAEDVASCFPSARDRITPTYFGTPSWVLGRPSGTQAQPGERPFFLFVGTLEPRKNLESLLIAYEQFLVGAEARSRPQSEVPSLLFIGGTGWSDSRLRKRIGDFVALGHLEVRDYCDANELWHFYRTAHALLFPSLHEGFGFPILEAMAAGLPVLTSQRGAMAEVGGNACVLVEPDDPAEMAAKMASIAWDQTLRTRLREEGLLRSLEWSWDRTADQTLSVYRRLAPPDQIK